MKKAVTRKSASERTKFRYRVRNSIATPADIKRLKTKGALIGRKA